MPIRILKVSQTYYPYMERGGRPVKVKAMAEWLTRRGHRVTVLTARPGKKGESTEPHARDGTARSPTSDPRFPAFGWIPPVEVVYLPSLVHYRTLTINPSVVPFCFQRMLKFDVVHIYGTYDLLGPTVASFCLQRKVPYVLEPMGMFRPIVRNVRLKHIYRYLLAWPVVNWAARVIATSDLERDELTADGVPASKVVVRRNGVEIPNPEEIPPRGSFRREIGLHSEQPLVLYLGRLSRKKGLDLLLEAFSGVAMPAALAIVGPDDGDGCVQDIERLRDRLALHSRVHLLSPRFGAAKLAALADADVLVLPSRSENFGNVAAEAVACGLPVVVTDRCGIAPLLNGRAGLVVPCEVGAIRVALCRVLGEPALRASLRAGALKVRGDLSWDEPIAHQERLYTEVIKEGSPDVWSGA